MYAAQLTRPIVGVAVRTLSKFNQNPGQMYWATVKHVFWYHIKTIDAKIIHSQCGSPDIIGFCDADWASNTNDRHSATGYVFLLDNGAIPWNSRPHSQRGRVNGTERWALRNQFGWKYSTLSIRHQYPRISNTSFVWHQTTCIPSVVNILILNSISLARKSKIKINHLNDVPTDSMVTDILPKSVTPLKHKNFDWNCEVFSCFCVGHSLPF